MIYFFELLVVRFFLLNTIRLSNKRDVVHCYYSTYLALMNLWCGIYLYSLSCSSFILVIWQQSFNETSFIVTLVSNLHSIRSLFHNPLISFNNVFPSASCLISLLFLFKRCINKTWQSLPPILGEKYTFKSCVCFF